MENDRLFIKKKVKLQNIRLNNSVFLEDFSQLSYFCAKP